MPSLKDTKRRIGSVKSTQKITRAMKLVSSAKFARANRAVVNARPYGDAFAKMVSLIAGGGESGSPLMDKRPEKKCILIVASTDRGLCGGLNSNLFKEVQNFLSQKASEGVAVELVLWGKRAVMFGSKCREKTRSHAEKVLEKPDYSFVAKHAGDFCRLFEKREFDGIYVAYSHFRNAISQTPTINRLLPIAAASQPGGAGSESDFVFEPDREALVDKIFRQRVSTELYAVLLNGSASEHAARMTAMDNATNNADEVIKSLTLLYNRARQAAITKELIEITSGADAL